ncbi:MAG: serine/threonine protein kinase [Deltaproteobacteria bacterium]|nr:serine/threonine protein kinase [Deltaproteobacteria bacterium]
MAEIFVARHQGVQGFSRKIVIKRIRPHLSKEESFVRMFLNEAKLAAQLNHSNIGQIYDLGRIGASYFIAMEYVRGRDMRVLVRKADKSGIPFPLEYSLKVASEALEGLYYAHRKTDDNGQPLHIVHRDVTPENIMVSFDGEVKLLDFGIAKAENLRSETRAGEIKGKLGYMSPEQVMGKSLDHRSDIFSLGVVLYEWVAGQRLFGDGEDVDVLRNVVEGKIYPPSYFVEDLPEPVETLVMRALDRNREQRYQSAWDMQYDINRFMGSLPFIPSNIHLSNFVRQVFAEEIKTEERQLAEAEQAAGLDEDDEDGREITPSVAVDRSGTGPRKTKVEPAASSFASGQVEPQSTDPDRDLGGRRKTPPAEEPDPLVAELLAAQEGHMSVPVEIERGRYDMLKVIAERNGMSVPDLISQLVEQYTRFL